MTAITGVLTALRTTLARVDGLNVSLAQTGQINPPTAILGVPTVTDYRKAFAGLRLNIEPTITVLTSSAFDEIGTMRLAEFANPYGPKSIVKAIDDDHTLGGIVESARVVDFRPLSVEEIGAVGYYGGVFTVAVMARGDS
jgi:hypothetical protein